MSRKSLDSSSSNDEGSRANCNNKDVSGVEKRSTSTLDEMSTSAASLNHVKNVTAKYLNIKKADNSAKIENDVSQKAKTSNKVLNGRTFRDVIVNAKGSKREKDKATSKHDDSSDTAKEEIFSPSPTPSSLSSCSSSNSSPLITCSTHNLLRGNHGRESYKRRKTRNKTQQSLTKRYPKGMDENLVPNVNSGQENIDNAPTTVTKKNGTNRDSLIVDSDTFDNVTSKDDKSNGLSSPGKSKNNVRENISSPNSCSCSNLISNNNNNRSRFSNKLGHKKSKR